MSTNILLIIIIVLMVLGLILQLFQLFAILTIPNQFFDPLLDRFDSDEDSDDEDDIEEYVEPVLEKSTQGFVKTRKSKKAKWTVPDKSLPKKPRKDKRKTKGSPQETVTEVEVEVVNGAGEGFRAG